MLTLRGLLDEPFRQPLGGMEIVSRFRRRSSSTGWMRYRVLFVFAAVGAIALWRRDRDLAR